MARAALIQVAMELLYKYGGLEGGEAGHVMGLDYSTVSQGRKGLRERLKRTRSYRDLGGRIQKKLSRIKICSKDFKGLITFR